MSAPTFGRCGSAAPTPAIGSHVAGCAASPNNGSVFAVGHFVAGDFMAGGMDTLLYIP
jgi:hypothetical protein